MTVELHASGVSNLLALREDIATPAAEFTNGSKHIVSLASSTELHASSVSNSRLSASELKDTILQRHNA